MSLKLRLTAKSRELIKEANIEEAVDNLLKNNEFVSSIRGLNEIQRHIQIMSELDILVAKKELPHDPIKKFVEYAQKKDIPMEYGGALAIISGYLMDKLKEIDKKNLEQSYIYG